MNSSRPIRRPTCSGSSTGSFAAVRHLSRYRHLALSKAEPHDVFIRNCGKTLKALHIADNFGVKDDHRLPYIGNSVDWVKTAAALRETGYDGLINFEIPGERGCPRPVLEDKTRFARKLGETDLPRVRTAEWTPLKRSGVPF